VKVFDGTLALLERSLDARLDRQSALAGDIANAATPGYQPVDIDVEARLGSSDHAPITLAGVSATEGQLSLGAPPSAGPPAGTVAAAGGSPGLDGNRVDLDRTLASLAENALQYGAAARASAKKLAILSYVANDGS
jgi:flagellar basal-body rod protein FlgB